jgi:hypothetical protein
MPVSCRRSSLLLLALVVGCGSEKVDTSPRVDPCPPDTAPAQTIPILGMGGVCERYTGELSVRGNYAYTSSWGLRNGVRGDAIKVWDVSGNAPKLVDSVLVAGASTTGDVQVSDDGSLLGVATEYQGGSLVLYSLANPAKPTFVSRFNSADTDPGVHTAELARVGGKLYGFLSVAAAAKLVVLDLSNPAVPKQVLALQTLPMIHDVFVRDSLLFTAQWGGGVYISDIGGSRGGTPSRPVNISNVVTATNNRAPGVAAHNMWWFNDPDTGEKRWLFVGQEGPATLFTASSGDIHVVDMADITNPRQVAIYSLNDIQAGTHNFWVDEKSGVLYAAYYNGGVRAIDVLGDLGSCTPAQKTASGLCDLRLMGREMGRALASSDKFVWGVQQVGNRLYASDMLHGLWKLDISAFKR